MTRAPAIVRRHRIAAATPEHVGALVALYTEFEAARGRAVSEREADAYGAQMLERVFGTDSCVLLALVGKKIAGFIEAELWPQELGPFRLVGHVARFYVRPPWRRYPRIGHDLYTACRTWLLGRGAVPEFVVAPADVRRWERRGYRVMAVVMMADGEERSRG